MQSLSFRVLVFCCFLALATGCERLDITDDEPSKEQRDPADDDTPTGDAGYLLVPEALAMGRDANKEVTVAGFIVGYVDGTSMSKAVFGKPKSAANTNMLIAASTKTTDPAECLPVELSTKGENFRRYLNLYDNPGNFHAPIILRGLLTRYFGVAGLKSVVDYQWIWDGSLPDAGSDTPTPPDDSDDDSEVTPDEPPVTPPDDPVVKPDDPPVTPDKPEPAPDDHPDLSHDMPADPYQGR